MYMVMQCLGAICGAGVVKGFQGSSHYETLAGGANFVNHGYTKGDGLGSDIVGTFVLVYTVFSATDAKRSARDSHVPVCICVYIYILVLFSYLNYLIIVQQHCLLVSCLCCDCSRLCLSCSFSCYKALL
ncbi:hypothetical protein LguiB_028878 [Lonicera macranthoides]